MIKVLTQIQGHRYPSSLVWVNKASPTAFNMAFIMGFPTPKIVLDLSCNYVDDGFWTEMGGF